MPFKSGKFNWLFDDAKVLFHILSIKQNLSIDILMLSIQLLTDAINQPFICRCKRTNRNRQQADEFVKRIDRISRTSCL